MSQLRIRDRGDGYTYPFMVERKKTFLWFTWWGSWGGPKEVFYTVEEAKIAIERLNKIVWESSWDANQPLHPDSLENMK